MITDHTHLGLGVAPQLWVERLRVLWPERGHPSPRHDLARFAQPVEDPIGLQPIGRHAEVRREVGCRLVLGDGPKHVALLALQQLEQLLAHSGILRSRHDRGRPERLEPIGYGAEVLNHAVQVLIVQTECWHPHVNPRPDRDRSLQEGVQPVMLHARSLRRQHRRPQRRLFDQLQEIAAAALDDVAPDAVATVHEVATLDGEVAPRGPSRHRLCRLDLALEAHDRRQQPQDLLVRELEIRHPQLFERLKDAAFVVNPWIVQLRSVPGDLRRVRDVVHESEIEARDEFAAGLR